MKHPFSSFLVAVIAVFAFLRFTATSHALALGDPAPVVKGIDQDGKSLDLADVYKKGVTLVYFYPKADTSGCTAEACSLRDAYADFGKLGLQVVGVSEDKVEAQKKFQTRYHLPFSLVADTDGVFADAFGVPKMLGFAKRQSFLIKDGKIVWLDLKASTKEQAADVRKAYDNLKSAPSKS